MTAKLRNCLCSAFSFGSYGPDGSADSFEDYGTGCTQTTTNLFAQGHDAKLVGFFVRAELAGEEIATVTGGLRVTFGGAVQAAGTISEALAMKAQAQLDAAKARLAKKAAADTRKVAKKSAKAVEAVEASRLANIKIGRWTYTARIDTATGEATYVKKNKGLPVSTKVAQGQYSEV